MRYISNPRRSPRVPARLRVEVMCRGLDFRAETQDVGPRGCLVVSPQPLDAGSWLRLMFEADRLPEKLRVTGRVVWVQEPSRDRGGVAFADMQVERNQDPFAWFDRLVRSTPGLVPLLRHVPDRLTYDTPLYLLSPPRFIVDFSEPELHLIAGMRNGTTVERLLGRMQPERKNEGRLIFALLARRALGLSAYDACQPSAWRPLLRQAGVLSGTEADDEPEEVVRLADLTVDRDAAQAGDREILPSWLSQPVSGWSERAGQRIIVPPAREAAEPPGRPPGDAAGAEAPPLVRGAPLTRSPQAQQHYEHALAAAAAGDAEGALRLLRLALALSPRDAEIARALGQMSLEDRKAPER